MGISLCSVPFSFPQPPIPTVWQVTALLIAVTATTWTVATFGPEIRRLRKLEAQGEALAAEELRLESRLADIRRRQHWLETEPAYVEAIARDRLNLYRPGETVFRISRDSPSP